MPKATASAQRRQQLVEAAFEEIAANGFEGLRTRAVARAVGIDHSTVHHHFATKQDLITAVVDHVVGQFRAGQAPVGGPADQLRDHVRFLARLMRERPRLFVVARELDLRAIRDPAVRAIMDERDSRWRRTLTALLAEPGWPTAANPAAGAELVIAAVKGATFAPDNTAAAEALEQLLRFVLPEGEQS